MGIVDGRLGDLAGERGRAVGAGCDVTVLVEVTHFFGLVDPPGPEPVAVRPALHAAGAGEVVFDEELSGDGHWHVAAFCTLLLEDPEVKAVEQQMTGLAARHHLRYDGWTVTLTVAEERLAPGVFSLARVRSPLCGRAKIGRNRASVRLGRCGHRER